MARLLAERGLRVVLLERCRLPRIKTCGGGLVSRTWMVCVPLRVLPMQSLVLKVRRML